MLMRKLLAGLGQDLGCGVQGAEFLLLGLGLRLWRLLALVDLRLLSLFGAGRILRCFLLRHEIVPFLQSCRLLASRQSRCIRDSQYLAGSEHIKLIQKRF